MAKSKKDVVVEVQPEVNDTETTQELIGHPLVLFGDYSGRRTSADKRFGDKKNKFELSVPFPEIEWSEEITTLLTDCYGVSPDRIVELGINARVYAETGFDKLKKDADGKMKSPDQLEVDIPAAFGGFESDDFTANAIEFFEKGISSKPTPRKASETKKKVSVMDQLMAEYGVDTPEALKAAIKAQLATE